MAANTQPNWNHCHRSRTVGALTCKMGPGLFICTVVDRETTYDTKDFADKNILSMRAGYEDIARTRF